MEEESMVIGVRRTIGNDVSNGGGVGSVRVVPKTGTGEFTGEGAGLSASVGG